MDWRALWPYARTSWGWTVAIASALATIYGGPKLLFETWDWYMDRFFDYKVTDYLETRVQQGATINNKRTIIPIAESIPKISEGVGMAPWRVKGSLRRLKKKKQVTNSGDNWRIVPHE